VRTAHRRHPPSPGGLQCCKLRRVSGAPRHRTPTARPAQTPGCSPRFPPPAAASGGQPAGRGTPSGSSFRPARRRPALAPSMRSPARARPKTPPLPAGTRRTAANAVSRTDTPPHSPTCRRQSSPRRSTFCQLLHDRRRLAPVKTSRGRASSGIGVHCVRRRSNSEHTVRSVVHTGGPAEDAVTTPLTVGCSSLPYRRGGQPTRLSARGASPRDRSRPLADLHSGETETTALHCVGYRPLGSPTVSM